MGELIDGPPATLAVPFATFDFLELTLTETFIANGFRRRSLIIMSLV